MFPVMLSLADRLVVVVGGGPVGQRKVRALRAAGARVRLVCLEPRPETQTDPGLDWVCAPYAPDHLRDVTLVFAAGPPEVNARVLADAHARGLLVCSASDPDRGDFHVPATVRRGDLVVAVGTGGAAPALAQAVRDHLDHLLDDALTDWVTLLKEFRPVVLQTVADPARRSALFRQMASWHWLQALRDRGREAVRAEFVSLLREGLPPGEGGKSAETETGG